MLDNHHRPVCGGLREMGADRRRLSSKVARLPFARLLEVYNPAFFGRLAGLTSVLESSVINA